MMGATLLRLVTLRSLWIASAAAAILPALLTSVTATQIRMNLAGGRPGAYTDPSHLGLDESHLLLPVAMLVGVLAAHQELSTAPPQRGNGRQATATALAMPRRGRFAALEAMLTGIWAGVVGMLGTGTAMIVARMLLEGPLWTGEPLTRLIAMSATWAVMGMVAHALTHLFRTAVVPLVVLLILTTIVPAWAVLERLGGSGTLLPDAAGIALFHPQLLGAPPTPWVSWAVLGGWGLLAVAATAASRSRWPA